MPEELEFKVRCLPHQKEWKLLVVNQQTGEVNAYGNLLDVMSYLQRQLPVVPKGNPFEAEG